jgi:hypothetical protein
LKFDVPQSRISTREDQTTFTDETNTEIVSFVLSATSRAVLYNIPTSNMLKLNTSSVFATNKQLHTLVCLKNTAWPQDDVVPFVIEKVIANFTWRRVRGTGRLKTKEIYFSWAINKAIFARARTLWII